MAPGFVDLQVNGARRRHHRGARAAAGGGQRPPPVRRLCVLAHRRDVTVRGTAPGDRRAGRRPDGFVGAEPVGLHFEGPMLNPERRSAHAGRFLRGTGQRARRGLDAAGGRSRDDGTGAARAAAVIAQLAKNGVVVAAGHTAATVREMEEAIDAGSAT